jgi:hypothetical protein
MGDRCFRLFRCIKFQIVTKLAAIFNYFGDCECLMPYAVEAIRPLVDDVIVVWSRVSNRGRLMEYWLPENCILVNCEPKSRVAHENEFTKRQAGLQAAKAHGFTHFIAMDADEFYLPDEFNQEKERIYSTGIAGSIARVKTYFKSPTLTIGYDHTLVPFIHKITPKLEYHLKFSRYPFAVDKKHVAHIDPCRRLNIRSGVEMSGVTMHHYSYVRKNMALKIENSSANLSKSANVIYEDLQHAKPGYLCKSYSRILEQCDNIFNLPEYD